MNKASMFLCFLFFILAQFTYAQELTKEEKKQLANEIKSLRKDLEKFKKMFHEDNQLSREVSVRQSENTAKRNQLDDIELKISQKEPLITSMLDEINMRSRKLSRSQNEKVFFKVQIGAYKNNRIARIIKRNYNFEVEKDATGYNKYMVGYFISYWEAKKLSELLTSSGAQSFVVGYMNGNRVTDLKSMPQEYF